MSNKKTYFYLAFLFLLVNILCGIVAISLGKDVNWDLRNYHFYNGFAFIKGVSFYNVVPAQVQSFFNPLQDVFYYFLISHFPPKIAGFSIGFFQGCNYLFLFFITGLFLSSFAGRFRFLWALFLPCVALYTPIFVSELGNTMGDALLAPFVLGGVFFASKALSEVSPSRSFLLAGLLLGLASGLKFTFVPYFLAVILSFCLIRPRKFLEIFPLLVGFVLGFLLSNGYWMWLLYKEYKNPFFPFFNQIFKSPYILDISIKDDRWLPKGILDYILLPLRFWGLNPSKISELSFRTPAVPLAFFFCLFYVFRSLVSKKKSHVPLLFLSCFFFFSFFIWGWYFGYYRYAVILELLSPLLVFIAIFKLFRQNKRAQLLASSLFIMAILIFTQIPNWGRLDWSARDYFGVEPSAAFHLEKGLVFMTSYQAFSYIVPYFPESMRFVRLESSMNYLATDLWWKKVRDIIYQHKGSFYLLCPSGETASAKNTLSAFGFEIVFSSCQRISTLLDDFSFCRVKKRSEPS